MCRGLWGGDFFLPLHADYYRGLAAVSLRLCVDSSFYVRRKGGPGITDTKPEGREPGGHKSLRQESGAR